MLGQAALVRQPLFNEERIVHLTHCVGGAHRSVPHVPYTGTPETEPVFVRTTSSGLHGAFLLSRVPPSPPLPSPPLPFPLLVKCDAEYLCLPSLVNYFLWTFRFSHVPFYACILFILSLADAPPPPARPPPRYPRSNPFPADSPIDLFLPLGVRCKYEYTSHVPLKSLPLTLSAVGCVRRADETPSDIT